MTSPLQRSLALLKNSEWHPWKVEQWISYGPKSKGGIGGIRRDLWNVADLIAMRPGEPHLLIQVTTSANSVPHLKKLLANPYTKMWLETGGEFEMHSWRKIKRSRKARYKKVYVWAPRIYDFSVGPDGSVICSIYKDEVDPRCRYGGSVTTDV